MIVLDILGLIIAVIVLILAAYDHNSTWYADDDEWDDPEEGRKPPLNG